MLRLKYITRLDDLTIQRLNGLTEIPPPVQPSVFFAKFVRLRNLYYEKHRFMNKLKDFRTAKRIFGILSFLTAFVVYILTAEPTVSFWDAGEFISTSYKLQIGHPPGAPLYQMAAAVFSGLAPNTDKVAMMINIMSGFASALAVLMLYLTIIELLTYDKPDDYKPSAGEAMALIGSGVVGAMTLTFSDTFWFSAVEAEVYGPATFLSALIFWLGLKWTRKLDAPRANKWLLLIAFVLGLSFGVHFLAILTIPAVAMLYFFRKYPKFNVKQFIAANVIGVLILVVIFKVLMPWILKYYAYLEIFFINNFGLPFHSGTLIAALIMAFAFYKLLQYSYKKKNNLLETLTLSLLFLILGFSSWVMLPIRSNAQPPINENNPASARELLAYYNREQYGETYLFYGPYYTAYYYDLDKYEPYVDDKPKYEKDTVQGKYVIVNNYKKAKQNFTRTQKGLLPRMWDPNSAENYNKIMGYRPGNKKKPSLLDNLIFFVKYQLNYMYWRYFLWNFVGRQDDIQGHLDNHGNWISGIPFVDNMLGVPQKNMPDDMKYNKARNVYYFLPLLLGLIGMFFHYKRDWKTFYATLLLFIFTGIAVLFYTNVRPFEPRERDYAVVVSFYTFIIWVGMGVYALWDWLKDKIKIDPKWTALAVTLLSFVSVPLLMAKQNWDDHDRSRKYAAEDMARAYLGSVQKNGVIYTVGDNDTFPLWYMQEVEGYRNDVKVSNTSLLATDWYIDQMKNKTYKAEGLPIKMPHKKYVYGTRDVVIYEPLTNDTLDIKDFMNIVLSDKLLTKGHMGSYYINPVNNQKVYIYPTRYVRVPVNKENVIKYGIVAAKDSSKIVDNIILDLKGQTLYKSHLAMLDMLANNDWKRPIYFSGGNFRDSDYLWAKDYLQLDGLAYKLVPIKTKTNGYDLGRIDVDTMYRNLKNFRFTNMNKGIYLDPEARRNSLIYRRSFYRLADSLLVKGDTARAKEILDKITDQLPVEKTGYYYSTWGALELYYRMGEKEKARKLARTLMDHYLQYLKYFGSMSRKDLRLMGKDPEDKIMKLENTMRIIQKFDKELYDEYAKKLGAYMK